MTRGRLDRVTSTMTDGPDSFIIDDLPSDDQAEKRLLKAHSPRRARRREARLSRPIMALAMTPMIDVVFQLLVYFLVTTNFASHEEFFRLDLPRVESATAENEPSAELASPPDADPFALDREPIRVLVTSTGAESNDYRLEIVGPLPQPESFEALRRVLRDRLVDPQTGAGIYQSNHPVMLEPSPATTWEHSVEAFNAAVRAGYTNVIFQALP